MPAPVTVEVATAVATAVEAAVAAEREAVVAWLRAQAYLTLYEAAPSDIADAIESGEHRREGDE